MAYVTEPAHEQRGPAPGDPIGEQEVQLLKTAQTLECGPESQAFTCWAVVVNR